MSFGFLAYLRVVDIFSYVSSAVLFCSVKGGSLAVTFKFFSGLLLIPKKFFYRIWLINLTQRAQPDRIHLAFFVDFNKFQISESFEVHGVFCEKNRCFLLVG